MHRYKLKKKSLVILICFGSSNVNVTEHLFEKQNCYFFLILLQYLFVFNMSKNRF